MNKTTKSGKEISKIGIGTYGIGGRGHRDVELTEIQNDQVYIDAIAYSLNQGLNFGEISAGYGHGNALRLYQLGLDQSNVKREDVFLTNSLYPRDLVDIDVLKNDINLFYETFKTDYADSTLITQSIVTKFGQTVIFQYLHDLLEQNKTRFVSVSNCGPEFIKTFKAEFSDSVFAHEGHLSFEVRALQDKGVFKLCDELGILNIIWRPLRRNMSERFQWPLLKQLADKYGKTQNQIILNWICHLSYHPMVMSANIEHINENIASIQFEMTPQDYDLINNFRPEDYYPPQVDWEKTGQGDSIITLVSDFEKHIRPLK